MCKRAKKVGIDKSLTANFEAVGRSMRVLSCALEAAPAKEAKAKLEQANDIMSDSQEKQAKNPNLKSRGASESIKNR